MLNAASLVEFSSDPAFALDADMRVISWNGAAQELLGYSSSAAIGLPCSAVLAARYPTGEKLCSALCSGVDCFKAGKKWGVEECLLRHMNGDMLPAGISSLVLPKETRSEGDNTTAIIFLRKAYSELSGVEPERRMQVFTLGRFALAYNGKGLNVEGWKRKKAAVVLKILISNLGLPVHREQLIDWIWPEVDSESGWKRLKVTVSSLRSELRNGGVDPDIIETVGQSYILRDTSVRIDTVAFCDLIEKGQEASKLGNLPETLARFEKARTLYSGELFEDEPYADWCSAERERLREIHLELLACLASSYAENENFLTASQICRMALSTDPCRENFVRLLMMCFRKMGRLGWARSYFLTWRRLLDHEYGLEPTKTTMNAFQDILEEVAKDQRKLA